MGRWRPPPERATALVTRDGLLRLQAELDELWRLRRPEVVRALAAAAAEGDRSENAEYIYRKKQLAEIDRRVRYLARRLPSLRVVETAPADPGRVWFGAWVEIEHQQVAGADARSANAARWVADGAPGPCATDAIARHRIVGPDETDARQRWISVDSPLARALLGRRVDDEFEVELPAGRTRVCILEVRYREFDS
ncbi:MAG: GreA/GreB family elongation factor [Xanthomonadales bacterium]|nr:GreA/GreB family elongation factor [Xanthomonadales bacterium]